MNDDKNKKKVVVITGVTRGLGRAMAEKFIALGHTVAGTAGRSSSCAISGPSATTLTWWTWPPPWRFTTGWPACTRSAALPNC